MFPDEPVVGLDQAEKNHEKGRARIDQESPPCPSKERRDKDGAPAWFEVALERCALALFRAGRVSSSGDGCVVLALQVVADAVVEDLSRPGIVLIGQVATHCIADNAGRRSVILYLEIVAHGIAGARRLRRIGSDPRTAVPVILELQIAVYAGPAKFGSAPS